MYVYNHFNSKFNILSNAFIIKYYNKTVFQNPIIIVYRQNDIPRSDLITFPAQLKCVPSLYGNKVRMRKIHISTT